jgi:formate hydrogenlyase subunit 4
MTALAGILTQGLHIALVVAIAPLLMGAIRWLKARMQGRAAPHPLQPLRDMRKLLQKRPVMAENASWITRTAPYAATATALAARRQAAAPAWATDGERPSAMDGWGCCRRWPGGACAASRDPPP